MAVSLSSILSFDLVRPVPARHDVRVVPTISLNRRPAGADFLGTTSAKQTKPDPLSLLIKKTQQTPDKELKLARKRMKEVLHG